MLSFYHHLYYHLEILIHLFFSMILSRPSTLPLLAKPHLGFSRTRRTQPSTSYLLSLGGTCGSAVFGQRRFDPVGTSVCRDDSRLDDRDMASGSGPYAGEGKDELLFRKPATTSESNAPILGMLNDRIMKLNSQDDHKGLSVCVWEYQGMPAKTDPDNRLLRGFGMLERPTLDIVIPVMNEELRLTKAVQTLGTFLDKHVESCSWITIADHGSWDHTYTIGKALEARYERVKYCRFHQPGRGRALSQSWMSSLADIVAYMDVDISTDLHCLPELLRPLLEAKADISVGTRLAPASKVQRSWKREILSRTYNRLIQTLFDVSFTDAQCSFKAAKRKAVGDLIPLIRNEHWFWDTECLLLANHLGLRIASIPVAWAENKDSRMKIFPTIQEDLQGLVRMRRTLRSWNHPSQKYPQPNMLKSNQKEEC